MTSDIDRFDHVTVVVHDVDAACARYAALLGIPAGWRGEHPELGTRAALFGLRNGIVELVGPAARDERDAGLRELLDAQGEGLQAIAFGTTDADACRAALRERGVRVAPPVTGEARGEDGEARHFRAVELSERQTRGVRILVVQREDLDELQATAVPRSGLVDALDHIVVRTATPDAAVELYRDRMGIRLALDRELGAARMLFFRVGGVTLEVVHTAEDDPGRDRLHGLALRVGDIDKAHARLAQAGFALSDVRDGNKPGTRVFTVREGTCGVPTLIIRDPARD